jgi:hypothetical protein
MGIQGFFREFMKRNDNLEDNKKYINIVEIDNTINKLYIDFINILFDILNDNPNLNNNQKETEKLFFIKIIEKYLTIIQMQKNIFFLNVYQQ